MVNSYPAIVIATFNRPDSLHRLLNSIQFAAYPAADVPLVISIDGGGEEKVLAIADDFDWRFGTKRIIRHEKNIGLRSHILSCGDLTVEYGSIIMLEDDLVVSPAYYSYALSALSFFENDDRIAGISLYSYKTIPFADHIPFVPISNGYDNFFMQVPSSWGQVWTKSQWASFKAFYNSCPLFLSEDKMPEAVKKWPESSWLKYYFKHMVESDKYFVFPYKSYSSNWGDSGTHYMQAVTVTRTVLASPLDRKFNFVNIQESVVLYDAYMDLLPESFKALTNYKFDDFVNDLSGLKQIALFKDKVILTTKNCSSSIADYGIEMLPLESNIFYDVPGAMIHYANSKDVVGDRSLVKYHLCHLIGYDAYEYGRQDGLNAAKVSTSFKIGHIILAPIRGIKKLFSHGKKAAETSAS